MIGLAKVEGREVIIFSGSINKEGVVVSIVDDHFGARDFARDDFVVDSKDFLDAGVVIK